jgi:hypothetical protein
MKMIASYVRCEEAPATISGDFLNRSEDYLSLRLIEGIRSLDESAAHLGVVERIGS